MTLIEIARIYTDLVEADDLIPAHEYIAKDEITALRTKYHQMFMEKLTEEGIEFVDRFDAARKAFELVRKALCVLFIGVLFFSCQNLCAAMSQNKTTVEKYMTSYTKGDVKGIESTLTDDVVWDLPGAFHWEGKKAFMKETSDGFARFGLPLIITTRLTEENDVVIAEGTVQSKDDNGNPIKLVFCDVFEMKGGKIKKLISYVMNLPNK